MSWSGHFLHLIFFHLYNFCFIIFLPHNFKLVFLAPQFASYLSFQILIQHKSYTFLPNIFSQSANIFVFQATVTRSRLIRPLVCSHFTLRMSLTDISTLQTSQVFLGFRTELWRNVHWSNQQMEGLIECFHDQAISFDPQ